MSPLMMLPQPVALLRAQAHSKACLLGQRETLMPGGRARDATLTARIVLFQVEYVGRAGNKHGVRLKV